MELKYEARHICRQLLRNVLKKIRVYIHVFFLVGQEEKMRIDIETFHMDGNIF